jgi:regulator of ribonuclease activity A
MTARQKIVYTSDIMDKFPGYDEVRVCEIAFRDYGAHNAFHGAAVTIATYENNTEIRKVLEGDGAGKVLVVDGRGSMRHALCGGNVALLAAKNNWAGVVFHGCVRDIHEIREAQTGIKAIGTNPRPPKKGELGGVGATLHFGGVTFHDGDYVYADEDGVIVTDKPRH